MNAAKQGDSTHRRLRIPRALRLSVILVILAGCADNEKNVMTDESAKVQTGGVTPADAPRSSRDFAVAKPMSPVASGGMGGVPPVQFVEVYGDGTGGGGAPGAAQAPVTPIERKILYTADIELVTEDLSKLESSLLRLVKQNGGYVADTDITGSTGSTRSARWKIRIPIEKFDSFLESGVKLGELTRRQINSADVTAEYYDLESRIKNKKVEEKRLLKHLEDTTAKLEDILAAERELSRVREEIERQEGRLRLLANLASLTTVTIQASERTQFIPATAPGFTTRATRAFSDSTKGLVDFAEFGAIWLLSLIPWLPLWLVIGVVILLIYRRIRRRVVAYLRTPRPTTP